LCNLHDPDGGRRQAMRLLALTWRLPRWRKCVSTSQGKMTIASQEGQQKRTGRNRSQDSTTVSQLETQNKKQPLRCGNKRIRCQSSSKKHGALLLDVDAFTWRNQIESVHMQATANTRGQHCSQEESDVAYRLQGAYRAGNSQQHAHHSGTLQSSTIVQIKGQRSSALTQ
jgi:hypothetical protein